MKKLSIISCLLCISTTCLAVTTPPSTPSPKLNLQDETSPTRSGSTRQKKWAQLIGKWFGSLDLEGGGKYTWINERKNDGTYKVQFRITDASGKKEEFIEVGEWGVSGDIYFTIYKGDLEGGKIIPVDTTNPTYRDAYRILNLTNDIFEYEGLDEGSRFSVRKVAPNFTLPE